MSTSVRARILRKNSFEFSPECSQIEAINCQTAVIEAEGWWIPQIVRGRFVGYNQQLVKTKPQADAVHVAKIRDREKGLVYWIALQDADSPQIFNDKCNACCDAVTDMPLMAILPDPQVEELACYNATTTKYEYSTYANPLAANQVYAPKGSMDNVYFTPATPAAGFANVAAFITWANANWSAYGTFSNVGQTVKIANNAVHEFWLDMNTPGPSADTVPVTDDTANTFNWTNNPSYPNVSDREQTLDAGATYTPLSAKPITGLTGVRAIGSVGVRIKAIPGVRPASATLFNAVAFT